MSPFLLLPREITRPIVSNPRWTTILAPTNFSYQGKRRRSIRRYSYRTNTTYRTGTFTENDNGTLKGQMHIQSRLRVQNNHNKPYFTDATIRRHYELLVVPWKRIFSTQSEISSATSIDNNNQEENEKDPQSPPITTSSSTTTTATTSTETTERDTISKEDEHKEEHKRKRLSDVSVKMHITVRNNKCYIQPNEFFVIHTSSFRRLDDCPNPRYLLRMY